MNIKMGLNRQITSAGSLGLFDIADELIIRIVTENAGIGNVVIVKGRIKGQSNFTTLETINGSTNTKVVVASYEEIEIECTNYENTNGPVKVIATSFDQDIASSAIPVGGATAARQDTGNASLASIDAKTPALVGGKVPVDISNISGTVEITNDVGNAIPMSAASLPLPSGASTSALQTTGNTSLSNIDGKLPALTAGNRVPVDIGGNGSITITSGTITVSNEVEVKNDSGNPVPISGTVTANTGLSQPLTDAQLRTTPVPISGALTDTQLRASAVPVSGPLTDTQLRASALPVSVSGVATAINQTSQLTELGLIKNAVEKIDNAIDDINGVMNVSVTSSILPTGASTSALQTTGNTSLSNIDTKLPSNLTVTSTRLLVDGSGVTQPISVAALPLPTNAATESTLSGMSGKLPATLGQKISNQSLSVVIASDQSPLPISGTITSTQVAGVEDATNSSTSPLLANAVFTGAAFNVTGYVAINVNIKSDVPSATGGVRVEFSPDGTNWDHSHSTTYTAATGVGYIFNVEYKFARVVYTNGATPQTYFRLQTIFKSTLTKSSLYTLSQSINSNMFAELGRSVITGETTAGGGGYVNVKVDPSGAMITATTIDTALPAGNNNIGNIDVVTLPVSYNAGPTDAQTQRVVVANDQTIPVSATSLPLPTGAATSALQTTGNSTISSFSAKTAANLIVAAHDEVVVTYVGTSNRISTVVYKLATATVATLTFTYDGSNRLTGVVRS